MTTQAERRATTRGAILAAAEDLFGCQDFAATTMDQIAVAAAVAKGAIYHHFPTKEAVFEAVFQAASAQLAAQLAIDLAQSQSQAALDALALMARGVRAYFSACAAGPTGQIILKDGPAVLGWERWREIDEQHFGGIVPASLEAAMQAGLIRRQPVEPLAGLLIGAINEAAAACNASSDPAATGRLYADALEGLLEGLRTR
jgi:AcrR family transcriptional regulator